MIPRTPILYYRLCQNKKKYNLLTKQTIFIKKIVNMYDAVILTEIKIWSN